MNWEVRPKKGQLHNARIHDSRPLTPRQQAALSLYEGGAPKKTIAALYGKETLGFALDKLGRAH